MKKNATIENDPLEENKSLKLGEPVRMITGHEKPRFTGKDLEELRADLEARYPDSPELLDGFPMLFGAKTGQEIRDVLIYTMLENVLSTLDRVFYANKSANIDHLSMSEIRRREFNATFKYKINL